MHSTLLQILSLQEDMTAQRNLLDACMYVNDFLYYPIPIWKFETARQYAGMSFKMSMNDTWVKIWQIK